jgi:hypothetical protein
MVKRNRILSKVVNKKKFSLKLKSRILSGHYAKNYRIERKQHPSSLVLRKQNLIRFISRKSIHAKFKNSIGSGIIFPDPTDF